MYDFLEYLKEEAELSKREVVLGTACGVLAGLFIGFLIGAKVNRPPKPPKKVVIKEVTREPKAYKPIDREDYE